MKVIYNNKEVANTTLNYNQLLNKPLLNSRELVGNVSLSDINVYDKNAVDNLIASTRSVKAVTSLPSPLVENTMYYVGPDADDNYHVYLVDSALTLIDLGMAKDAGLYKNGVAIDIDTDNKINVQLDYTTTSVNSEGKIEVTQLKGTKGANDKPIYLADGQLTASNATIGSSATDAIKPIYMNSGKLTASAHTAGGTAKPVYVDSGTIKPISATVGNAYTPVYLNNGTITEARILTGTNSSQAAVTLPAIPVVSNELGAMEVGQIIDFHTLTSGTITPDQNFAARLQFAASNKSLILWNEDYGGVQQGAILTEKSVDNTSLKVDSGTHKVYANYSDTLLNVSGVDSAKVTLSKEAIRKYSGGMASTDGYTVIPENADLNTTPYLVVGNYVCNSGTTAATMSNCPTDGGFRLEVQHINAAGGFAEGMGSYDYRLRTITDQYGRVYVQRVYTNASTTSINYGAWNSLITSDLIKNSPEVANGQGNIDSTWTSFKGNTYGLRAYEARTTNVAGFVGVYTGIDSGANNKIISYELNTTHRGGWVAGKQLFFSNCTSNPSVIIDGGFVGNAAVSPKITTKIQDTDHNRYYVDFDTMLDRDSGGSGTGWLWNIRQKWTRESATSKNWFLEFSVFRHGGNVTFHGRAYVEATGADVAPGLCLVTSADPPGLSVREFVIYSN